MQPCCSHTVVSGEIGAPIKGPLVRINNFETSKNMMSDKRKTSCNAALVLLVSMIFYHACTPTTVPAAKVEKIKQFLKTSIAERVQKDYQSHDLYIHVLVTDLAIDRITIKETAQDTVYDVQGRVSYVIQGKRNWIDKEGNAVQLGPEQVITHWFTSGVLEDKYLGTLFNDERNRFTFYADKPTEQR